MVNVIGIPNDAARWLCDPNWRMCRREWSWPDSVRSWGGFAVREVECGDASRTERSEVSATPGGVAVAPSAIVVMPPGVADEGRRRGALMVVNESGFPKPRRACGPLPRKVPRKVVR